MNRDQISKLLADYLAGNTSEAENAIINSWYEKYESDPDYVRILSRQDRDFLKRKIFNTILEEVETEDQVEPGNAIIIPLYQKQWFRIISAAVIILIAGFAFFFTRQDIHPKSTYASNVYLINNALTISKKVLSDGSIVWLKPKSALTFPKKFGKGFRNVQLVGEGFFEITKDPKHPFIITSSHLVTKVWGTSFQVVDFENTIEPHVTVVSGKVSVRKNISHKVQSADVSNEEVMLLPKQKALISKTGDLTALENVNMQTLGMWSYKRLNFENQKLTDIVKVLNSNFDVEIRLADTSLQEKSMTADFDGLNLPEVLEIIKASMRVDYELSGNKITLKNQNNK